ncbi:MAG: S1/P1 nuclease [Gammaproteobacteria bacterium]|nr:S1/P1 nuclease [Gammaproteobacteria bacterium]
MMLSVRKLALLGLLLLGQCGLVSMAHAWDATGHRLSAYLTWDILPQETRAELQRLLEQHPRYQEDFLDQMPANVLAASDTEKARWTLGQAAIWPDMARGLGGDALIRYNRPNWHWVDGAWIRGGGRQGNVYVGTPSLAPIYGVTAESITHEDDATNVVLALDYNLSVLRAADSPDAQKAVALCWVLHLLGDIHQPLHAGALMSSEMFPHGDQGGNGIPTLGGSLHSTWDDALHYLPFDGTLQRMVVTAQQTDVQGLDLDSSAWLQESRKVLLEFVYPDEIKARVLRSERRNTPLESVALDEDYISRMQTIAEDRVTLAGMRLARLMTVLYPAAPSN